MNGVSDGDNPDKLARYRQKRDPGRTTEPFAPELLPSATAARAPAGASWGGPSWFMSTTPAVNTMTCGWK